MVNNLILRIISAIIMVVAVVISFQSKFGFRLFMLICTGLMVYEWVKINKNKESPLFIYGLCYIIAPMLFWIYESYYFYETINGIMWCFLIVWSCDIFAYFGGKLFKGPKFAPKISPNKTWSGVICGGIAAFIISYFYIECVFEYNKIELVFASLFMIIASILGDLLESKVKRVLQVKDTSNIIPGHGGICDRLDSFLLVTYAYIIIKYILL